MSLRYAQLEYGLMCPLRGIPVETDSHLIPLVATESVLVYSMRQWVHLEYEEVEFMAPHICFSMCMTITVEKQIFKVTLYWMVVD